MENRPRIKEFTGRLSVRRLHLDWEEVVVRWNFFCHEFMNHYKLMVEYCLLVANGDK